MSDDLPGVTWYDQWPEEGGSAPPPPPPKPPQQRWQWHIQLENLAGDTPQARKRFWLLTSVAAIICVWVSLYFIVWSRLRYHLPTGASYVAVVLALIPSVILLMLVRRLHERAERQRASATQLGATSDVEHQHVHDRVVNRAKYLLTIDEERPHLSELQLHMSQREHWEALIYIVWFQVVLAVGLIAAFTAFDKLAPWTLPWWLWLVPVAVLGWGFIRGMTQWYFTLYLVTNLRLIRATVPPLPFVHDVDHIKLSSLTNARREKRWLSTLIDSVPIKLEGIGDSNPSEDTRWDRLPYMRRAEEFETVIEKFSDRLRSGA